MSRLAILLAAATAALVFAGGALATPSGKPTHRHPGAKAPHAKPQPKPSSGAECPRSLRCDFVPAAYAAELGRPRRLRQLRPREPAGRRARDPLRRDPRHRGGYDDTIAEFQNSHAYVSAHYVSRSSDGHVTQMVPTKDVAWHAGNWWVNTHAVGIENEGYATELAKWFTPRLYRSLAKLTSYQAERYGIPLDREHIVGHDQVPGPTAAHRPGCTGTGPVLRLGALHAPARSADHGRARRPERPHRHDRPELPTNRPRRDLLRHGPCRTLPSQPTNFVYLHTAPSRARRSSPTRCSPARTSSRTASARRRRTTGATRPSPARASSSPAAQGDWTAIWYGGQKAWFENPHGHDTVAGKGLLVTPKAGSGSIPVYGRAYPSSVSTATLGYTIPAGQAYVAKDLVGADYYSASTFNAPETYSVVTGAERYYEISFNHRFAFVKASDVDVLR